MLATDDLQFGGPFAEWCRIAEDEGFECALADPFTGTYAEEEFRVYWHPEGLLMIGETFHWGEGAAKPSLNSSRLFFNWAHQTEPYDLGLHLSGCSLREKHNGLPVWEGYIHVSEGLRFMLRQFRANGEFVWPWLKKPFVLWLASYADYKGGPDSHKIASERRRAMLPEELRVVLCPDDATRGE